MAWLVVPLQTTASVTNGPTPMMTGPFRSKAKEDLVKTLALSLSSFLFMMLGSAEVSPHLLADAWPAIVPAKGGKPAPVFRSILWGRQGP